MLTNGRLSDRQRRIIEDGSPFYSWTPASIAASASSAIDLDSQFPESRKYRPLNWLEIVNADVVDVSLICNGNANETHYVPAGVIRVIDQGIGLNHLNITNLNAATATVQGKIVVKARRKPADADDLARRDILRQPLFGVI